METRSSQIYTSSRRILTNTYNFHLVTYIIFKNLFDLARLPVLIGFVQKKEFFDNRCNQLKCWLKVGISMKKLLHNKFRKQANLPGTIDLTDCMFLSCHVRVLE